MMFSVPPPGGHRVDGYQDVLKPASEKFINYFSTKEFVVLINKLVCYFILVKWEVFYSGLIDFNCCVVSDSIENENGNSLSS